MFIEDKINLETKREKRLLSSTRREAISGNRAGRKGKCPRWS